MLISFHGFSADRKVVERVFPFDQMLPLLLVNFGMILFDPIFWLVVLLIGTQIQRNNRMKETLFGVREKSLWQDTVTALGYGLAGGLAGSMLVVLLGLPINNIGLNYLWIVSVLMMLLVNIRFLCFAYSGGIISLSSLIFGFPEVDVPQLIALVAILHIVESVLILLSGHANALPVYTRNKQGRLVGGFTMQNFWPLPIIVLTMKFLPDPVSMANTINMPDWWPLIKLNMAIKPDNLVFFMLPVIAALGYGDLALTTTPEKKTYRSAMQLAVYSVLLLVLAVAASHFRGLAIFAALFAPLGHEYLVRSGQEAELNGKPYFVPPEQGVKILEVIKDSPAYRGGIRRGDIIMQVKGRPVNSSWQMGEAVNDFWGGYLEIDYVRGNSGCRRILLRPRPGERLGVIAVPEPGDPAHMEFQKDTSLLRYLLTRFVRNQ